MRKRLPMKVTIGDVNTWPQKADKALALKPLEEAAEVFGAWQKWQNCGEADRRNDYYSMLDEVADVIQACANLLSACGVKNASILMDYCEARNRKRGRFDK